MVIHRSLASLALAAALAGTLTGCYEDNCELRGTCPVLDMVPVDSLDVECDPASGVATDGCGVFVSADHGDDVEGIGTRYLPVRTLDHAIDLAAKGHQTVYACAELFTTPVVLPEGFRLLGGFDCAKEWQSDNGRHKTHVRVAPGQSALHVQAGNEFTWVVDFSFEAVDATEAGGSSIAGILEDGSHTLLERCDFTAGKGMTGHDGTPGSFEGPPPTPGAHGLAGSNACAGDAPSGGSPVQVECDDGVFSVGGIGGSGGPESGLSGTEGMPAPASNPQGLGASGAGEDGVGTVCLPGVKGADGMNGFHGLGGHGAGYLSGVGYVGHNGIDGDHGLPGQGGGGGGGARGGPAFCGNKPMGGAGGGSGGSGGCGGHGAKGGGFGGASIGLAVADATLVTLLVRISAGDGGDGGIGSLFQPGGDGGFEGLGGHGNAGSNAGCAGGTGGRGGRGGYSGGASGGPSVGVAHTGDLGSQDIEVLRIGRGGRGGHGGNPNFAETEGDDGFSAELGWLDRPSE